MTRSRHPRFWQRLTTCGAWGTLVGGALLVGCDSDSDDPSHPTGCGNGTVEPGEQCDGADLAGASCESLGFEAGGLLGCTAQCQYDTASCEEELCGNDQIDPAAQEACDGDDLGNETCQSQGLSGGQLACDDQCNLDMSGCFACGDGTCEPAKGETAEACPADCDSWVAMSLDMTGTYALRADGALWSWGHSTPWPEQVFPELDPLVAVASRMSHACAADAFGLAYCWGGNNYGGLGDGTTDSSTTPVLPTGLDSVTTVGVGDGHSCAAKSDGTLWCWGLNGAGQLGIGQSLGPDECMGMSCSTTPEQVQGLTDATTVTAGGLHNCAIDGAAVVWCWGCNAGGKLGDGTTNGSAVPVQTQGLSGVASVSAGAAHTCAITQSQVLWCWGNNPLGQLGDGTTSNQHLPVQVVGLSDVSQVSAGTTHTCAVTTQGQAWCWGGNGRGQLGDGSGIDSPVPVQPVALSDVVLIAAGIEHSCAAVADGSIYCWGANDFGQLGDGTTDDQPAPVLVMFL